MLKIQAIKLSQPLVKDANQQEKAVPQPVLPPPCAGTSIPAAVG